jgi:hypothetical protein
MAGLISGDNVIPNTASSLIVVGTADETGFTGTQQALQLAKFFPPSLTRCVVIIRGGVINLFDTTLTTLSGSGDAVLIDSIFCSR